MTEEQFIEITNWQKETFGQATSMSKLAHLEKEIYELEEELKFIKQNKDNVESEFADCFILLFGAAASNGMNYEDICNCIESKMKINKQRKWGKPDENGVVNHVKQTK